tara:strand:- start:750 stop:854 length:105 start_codon:yes stop_codon:yes gene_type:complete
MLMAISRANMKKQISSSGKKKKKVPHGTKKIRKK